MYRKINGNDLFQRDIYDRCKSVALCEQEAVVTGNIFSVATTAGTVAQSQVLGRSAYTVARAGAATDGTCFQATPTILPQVGVPIFARASFLTGNTAGNALKNEFCFGFGSNSTTVLATPVNDFIYIRKLLDEPVWSLVARRNGGTAMTLALPTPTLIDGNAWYDFAMKIERDPTTAGAGLVTVGFGQNLALGAPFTWLGKIPIATQFPLESVALAPQLHIRVGVNSTAVVGAGQFDWVI